MQSIRVLGADSGAVPARGIRLRTATAALGLLLLSGLALSSCGDDPTTPAGSPSPTPSEAGSPSPAAEPTGDDGDRQGAAGDPIAELRDRSFRQFEPSREGDPRRAVIIEFFGPGIQVWAQYAEGDHAIDEWEVMATDYRVEWDSRGSQVTIHFINPRFVQTLPEPCEDCITVTGFSISIRNPFDPERIAFRLNDPDRVLPSPFPVFEDWTRFNEDEYFD